VLNEKKNNRNIVFFPMKFSIAHMRRSSMTMTNSSKFWREEKEREKMARNTVRGYVLVYDSFPIRGLQEEET